jgi:hypothetical protein
MGAACGDSREPTHAAISSGACQGTLVITLQLSEMDRRALGAPRAVMPSQVMRAHPSRTDDLEFRSAIRRINMSSLRITRLGVFDPETSACWDHRRARRPETRKGRLGSPRRPLRRLDGSRQALRGPPERVVPVVPRSRPLSFPKSSRHMAGLRPTNTEETPRKR